MTEDADAKILDLLKKGNTFREIQEACKVGNIRIKTIRDANLSIIPIKERKKVIARSRSKISNDPKDFKNDFLLNFKDRNSRRTSTITQDEKEHLRECLIAGNHQRSFSRDMMKEALRILDKI